MTNEEIEAFRNSKAYATGRKIVESGDRAALIAFHRDHLQRMLLITESPGVMVVSGHALFEAGEAKLEDVRELVSGTAVLLASLLEHAAADDHWMPLAPGPASRLLVVLAAHLNAMIGDDLGMESVESGKVMTDDPDTVTSQLEAMFNNVGKPH